MACRCSYPLSQGGGVAGRSRKAKAEPLVPDIGVTVAPPVLTSEIISQEKIETVKDLSVATYAPWHDEVVRLACAGVGAVEIAGRLGKPAHVVSDLFKSEWFVSRLARTRAELKIDFGGRMAELWELTSRALKVQEMVLECFIMGHELPNGQMPTIQQALGLSNTLLDRFGMKSPEQININQNVTTRKELSYEERLELIKKYRAEGAEVPADLAVVHLDPGGRA